MTKIHKYDTGQPNYGEDGKLTDNWDPNKDYGNDNFVKAYFNVDAEYYRYPFTRYEGYEEKKEKFETECETIFRSLGWLVNEKGGVSCTTVVSADHKEDLYLHPQQFSGIIRMNSVGEITRKLDKASTFKPRYVELRETFEDIPDSKYAEILAGQEKEAAKAIFRACRTTRHYKYKKQWGIVKKISKDFRRNRIQHRNTDTYDKVEETFVNNIIDKMVLQGYLIQTEIDNELCIRSLNVEEQKKKKRHDRNEKLSFG